MSRPRIALVLATSTGGVGVHVQSLTRHLVAAGWPVTVCAPASTLALFDFAGARTTVVPVGSAGREPFAVPALRHATGDAALVHAHGLRAGAAAALTALITASPRPLVVTWHNAVLANGLRARVLGAGERFVARRATLNLAASADVAARISRLGARAVEMAPVAAPAPVPARTAAAVRAELGMTDGRPLIVSVGRLHPQKAVDVLIGAAARWSQRGVPPLVVVAGDGPLHAELAQSIAQTGAPVRLLGRRTDVADLLAAADVVALASRWEARPLAVQEAMSLGRAVVATDVGGVAALVGDGAMLVPSGDVGALSTAVARLLDDPAERADLERKALLQARTWPTEDDTARACVAVYQRLLG